MVSVKEMYDLYPCQWVLFVPLKEGKVINTEKAAVIHVSYVKDEVFQMADRLEELFARVRLVIMPAYDPFGATKVLIQDGNITFMDVLTPAESARMLRQWYGWY